MSENPMLGEIPKGVFKVGQRILQRCDGSVFDASTPHAGNVIVIIGLSIETHLRLPGFKFTDETAGSESVEIPIDRSHADPGQSFPHAFINFISSGMRSEVFDLFQDDLTLIGHSIFFFKGQMATRLQTNRY